MCKGQGGELSVERPAPARALIPLSSVWEGCSACGQTGIEAYVVQSSEPPPRSRPALSVTLLLSLLAAGLVARPKSSESNR